ncbi:Ubiquitin-like modifier-activating enzyme ATG7 [Orchesella cincta]|uniref:Ubiquitin-like modifier-activating enzyme ATG7 n=1 Tax=Orchesella cincta TaxID=48709 RepID=A0A1D2N3H5_ORCCI|nr:Ubiquitin-like modifier-activating enzyme ATG7 [Orchesella cincta]
MAQEKLLFCPNSSQIDSTFWGSFCKLKLDVLGLNEEPLPISGQYGANEIPNINPVISVDHSSFDTAANPYSGMIKVPGLLINTNTAEQFKQLDKNELMVSMGSALLGKLWSEDGLKEITKTPSILGSFYILTFADLKKYKFIYWFAFPAVTAISVERLGPSEPVLEYFKNCTQVKSVFSSSKETLSAGFFIVNKSETGQDVSVKSLESIDEASKSLENVIFGFIDPSSLEEPGWVLRNYLTFIIRKLKLKSGTVITMMAHRPKRASQLEKGYIFRVKVEFEEGFEANPKFVGWERNVKGAFGPRQVDLQMSMNPEKLAESSVDLNLKLMKWRLFPDFNLEAMHQTKCLILGAGTLGCNVARCLMGWGIRNIVFVDNGKVSYSNPARQSLYTFQDCIDGGRNKSQAAAENLKSIFPGMNTSHKQIMIPMPGHPTSEATISEVKKDYETLVQEVQDCDVMFLLLDTRESRWLPTVLGQKYGKIVINAALGFDSYLVMRHGPGSGNPNVSEISKTLGCYFCTDVVAPGDSTRDRTLDQQCTVTRPGVSMIAGALAVEMMAALLHHPEKNCAKASNSEPEACSPLGIIPHSIRGFLSSGQTIMPSFQPFDKCTACSEKIIQEYDSRGFEFVLDVLNEPADYLEKLTGLNLLKDDFDSDGIVELSDSEDDHQSVNAE